ncbi:MFS transporter [Streptomyces sp. DSM 42041]|uniref:MFS transporter n=1 Tax=Streptomyces hazeniae TaxID=3075538 RepID=A0ABU2P136_9ACTN|nr:MFS transporter [Streptomyces sp. DSM 42041]MDT0381618.1 MFS transporter [Streptomyces sp. DSM 42041]
MRARRRWMERWDPEDRGFWETEGRHVARRNLVGSVCAEHVGFSVWSMFAVLALFMGEAHGVDAAGKFTLVAVASLVGGALRVPYGFAVARYGGRDWTAFSAALLLVPCAGLCAVFAAPPGSVPYGVLLLVAVTTGVGGANFASSTANVNAFYPLRLKGRALGLNAGGGNIGVAVVQLAGLGLIALGGAGHPWVLPALYVPLVVAATVWALRRMDNLGPVRGDTGAVAEAARHRHTWIVAALYIGTFGSFIGYGFAFGLVLQGQFGRTPLEAASLTFVGPLLGSLLRPVGGHLADRWGGARVTLAVFALMTGATVLVVGASVRGSLPLFVAGFVLLFVLTGAGNGSVYALLPGIHEAGARSRGLVGEAAAAHARRMAGAAMSLIGAVGAFGGVGINLALSRSFAATGSGTAAFAVFAAYYVLCGALVWAVYVRPPRPGPAPAERARNTGETPVNRR